MSAAGGDACFLMSNVLYQKATNEAVEPVGNLGISTPRNPRDLEPENQHFTSAPDANLLERWGSRYRV
jgi:hypothetical protein